MWGRGPAVGGMSQWGKDRSRSRPRSVSVSVRGAVRRSAMRRAVVR